MSRLDYSKWDKIEISDDEDDTHPNVDTPSLFKWRHEARVERKKQQEEEKAKRKAQLTIQEQKINFLRKTKEALAKEAEEGEASEASKAQLKGVEEELARLQVEHDEFTKKEAELERWEREHPTWDVDNISQEKSSRTIINGYKETKPEKKDDVDDMTSFFKKHGDEVEAFAKLTKYEDSHKFLSENKHLVTDHTASYLVIYCVDLAVEEKEEEMKRAAHQTIIIQYILELAKSMKRHPVECLQPFFVRMAAVAADGAGNEYKAAFNDELNSLIQRVRDRAVARLEEAQAKMEAERKAQLKPGELDPLEVLESLPEKIKKAFKAQDTPMLQQGFAELSPEDAKYHYDRVVKSGLWVPAGGDGDEEEEGEAAAASS